MAEQETLSFKKGDIIYRQNDYEMRFFSVLYGGVSLYQNYGTAQQVLIKEIGPNSFLGEMELIEARPRTTTAVATEATMLKVFSGDDFSALFQEKPAMVLSIMQQMSARIRELTRQYNEACRVVAEAMDAEKSGREKSRELQSERKKLSDYYNSYLKLLGGGLTDE